MIASHKLERLKLGECFSFSLETYRSLLAAPFMGKIKQFSFHVNDNEMVLNVKDVLDHHLARKVNQVEIFVMIKQIEDCRGENFHENYEFLGLERHEDMDRVAMSLLFREKKEGNFLTINVEIIYYNRHYSIHEQRSHYLR